MSHEIEADYVEDYYNEEKHCPFCESYSDGYCEELEQEVSLTANCNFFKSKD